MNHLGVERQAGFFCGLLQAGMKFAAEPKITNLGFGLS
jgi:hypothetical protein